MSTPKKCPSRPLLPIDDTIKKRLSLNIEFIYWVSEFGINVSTFQNSFFRFRKIMKPQARLEENIRPWMLKFKERVGERIKKYVGEYY